ncbi:hypothetical protein ACIODX_38280 [Streptomyces sp. NPDC088190]|uniref:hypothetical protein n=1 Tax=unclassified Streptomyces TaxID=2593676 RepID=UPI002E79591B|nr:hypothetical protein [Streptomyces sp. JV190]MEE1838311.1 hypothetical protein [Streptomyces sp. JV190]
MAIGFTSAIADFDQKHFDSLDRTAGYPSSYTRLRQKEQDPRWISRYLEWADGGLLKAAIPVYRSRMNSWPDKAYDPRSWVLPDGAGDECSPGSSLLVGGCGDRRTGLHLDAEAKAPGTLRSLLVELARLAADENRCLAFPYMHAAARNALSAATDNRIVWAELAREAHIVGLSDAEWESKLPRKIRKKLRQDRCRIAAAPVAVGRLGDGTASWDEVRPWAAELISHQHAVKGDPEPSEFVNFRYSDLQENPDLDVFVFTAQSPGLRGVTTAVVWEGEMELCEVGLRGENSEERIAVYLSTCFHQPFQYAQARGIDHIRCGSTAEATKAARGAVFTEYYGGVLAASETKRLAHEGS